MSDGDVVLIEPAPEYRHLFGRHVSHDPRNRSFAALELVQHGARVAQSHPGYGWARRDVFDQVDSNCTMEAFAGLLHMPPAKRDVAAKRAWPEYDTEAKRVAAYKESQAFDPWEGSDYDGTSSDAPYRRAVQLGHIPSYWWLFGEAQVWEYVSLYGPVTVGTKWTQGMLNPDAKGFLHPTGPEIGGHEWTLIDVEPAGGFYVMQNSWGPGWGSAGNGRARITRANLSALLADQGDAITIGT